MSAKAYWGRGGWLATPFLTVKDGEAFEGGGRMSAACAAVHLLLE
jgi:hypothetical protein